MTLFLPLARALMLREFLLGVLSLEDLFLLETSLLGNASCPAGVLQSSFRYEVQVLQIIVNFLFHQFFDMECEMLAFKDPGVPVA